MATVGNLQVRMVADIRPFRQEVKRTADEVRRTRQELQRVDQSVGSFEQVVKSATAATEHQGGAVKKTGKHLAAFAAHVVAGIAAEEAFRHALQKSGVAVGKHSAAVNILINTSSGATAATAGLTSGLRTAAKMMIGRFLPAIGLVLGAAGLVGLNRRLTEFGAQASNVAPVTNAFDNLAEHVGTTGEVLRRELKQAVSGTVSEFDLMKSSVIALNSEAIRSPEVLAEIARSARILGRTVDMETTDAFDNIVRGVGLMNPQLLKSVGVLVSVDEATRAYAEAQGRAVSSLSDHERHAAFLEAVMEKLREATGRVGNETDDLGTILQQADAASEDFSREIRTAVAEAEGIRRANKDWAEIRLILNEIRRDTLPGLAGAFANAVGQATHAVVTGPLQRFLSGEMLDVGEQAWDLRIKQVRELATATNVLSATGPQGFGVEGQILLPPPTGGGVETPARPAVPGFESFLEMNERAIGLTADLKRQVQDIPAIDIRFGPEMAELIRNPAQIAGSLQFLETIAQPGRLMPTAGPVAQQMTDQELTGIALEDPRKGMEDLGDLGQDVAASISSDFGRALSSIIKGTEDVTEAFGQMATSIITDLTAMIAKTLIFRAIMGAITGGASEVGTVIGGVVGGPGALVPGLPGRAHGGPVHANRPFLVGEQGPELFVPRQTGRVVSNRDMQGGGGPSAGAVASALLGQLGPPPQPQSPREVRHDAWWREAFSALAQDFEERS